MSSERIESVLTVKEGKEREGKMKVGMTVNSL